MAAAAAAALSAVLPEDEEPLPLLRLLPKLLPKEDDRSKLLVEFAAPLGC